MGSETLNISPTIGIANHIGARHLALAMGVILGADRLGSYAADMSARFFAPSLAAALVYWAIDRQAPSPAAKSEPFVLSRLFDFGKAYWYLLFLCLPQHVLHHTPTASPSPPPAP